MLRLNGDSIHLATLEREDCQRLWNEFEYDHTAMTEPLNIGHSREKADAWFEEIQRHQGEKHIRLGVFLHDGTVMGDIAFQDINWKD
ncbi:MAG: hypothetical protein ACOYEP_05230 [Limnochordia bacterium]